MAETRDLMYRNKHDELSMVLLYHTHFVLTFYVAEQVWSPELLRVVRMKVKIDRRVGAGMFQDRSIAGRMLR